MSDDEIYDICQQAESLANRGDHVDVAEMVKQAVRLAVEREREACAELCENITDIDEDVDDYYSHIYATAIRARGE